MMQRALGVLGGAIIVLSGTQALAGGLQVGRVSARPGQPITVPVSFTAGKGDAVTALTVDIHFDKGLINPRCAQGAVIANVDKVVRCAEVDRGQIRLLIFGFNQDPLPSGEVATVTFDVAPNWRRRLHRLASEVSASDADGKPIQLARKSGTVRVGTR